MKVVYNNADITEKTRISRCTLTQYLTGHVDTLTASFDNSTGLWTGWKPKAGDVLSVKEDYAESGQMIVQSINPEGDDVVIRAAGVQYINAGHTREWKDVTFLQLARLIAKDTGLALECYGVDDQKYKTVRQKAEGDLSFLDGLCKIEGCYLQVSGGILRIIADSYIDEMAQSAYIFDTRDARVYDLDYYSGCVVTDGTITGKSGSEAGELLTFQPNAALSSIGEANRFAANVLKMSNHERKGGTATAGKLISEVMPGSKIKLSCGWWTEKPIIVTKARYDLAKRTTKIWFRLAEEK